MVRGEKPAHGNRVHHHEVIRPPAPRGQMEIKAAPSELKSRGKLDSERRLGGRGGVVGGEEENTSADTSNNNTGLSLQVKALVVAEWVKDVGKKIMNNTQLDHNTMLQCINIQIECTFEGFMIDLNTH